MFHLQSYKLGLLTIVLAVGTQPIAFAQTQSSSQGVVKESPRSRAPAMKSAALDTAGANASGGQMNTMIGAGLMEKGTKLMKKEETRSLGRALFGMGIMAMIQAQNQKQTSLGAGDVSDLVDYGYNPIGPKGENDGAHGGLPSKDYLTQSGLSDKEANEVIANFKAAKNQGFAVDPKTGAVTMPGGKKVTPDSTATPASFAGSSGLPLSDVKKAYDIAAAEGKKAAAKSGKMIATMETESGGGAGGGFNGGLAGSLNDDSDLGLGHPTGTEKLGEKNIERKLAGMSKIYNGDPIGVSQDDIFLMMTRRYKLKQKQNFFLREDEAR